MTCNKCYMMRFLRNTQLQNDVMKISTNLLSVVASFRNATFKIVYYMAQLSCCYSNKIMAARSNILLIPVTLSTMVIISKSDKFNLDQKIVLLIFSPLIGLWSTTILTYVPFAIPIICYYSR